MNVLVILFLIVFFLVGIIFIIFPEHVKKYDQRMTLYIKDPDEYLLAARVFGTIILFLALSFGFMSFIGGLY